MRVRSFQKLQDGRRDTDIRYGSRSDWISSFPENA